MLKRREKVTKLIEYAEKTLGMVLIQVREKPRVNIVTERKDKGKFKMDKGETETTFDFLVF